MNAFGMAGVVEDVPVVMLVLRVRGRRFIAWKTVWSGGAGGMWFRDGVERVHEGECPRLHRAGMDRLDFEVVRVWFRCRCMPPFAASPSHPSQSLTKIVYALPAATTMPSAVTPPPRRRPSPHPPQRPRCSCSVEACRTEDAHYASALPLAGRSRALHWFTSPLTTWRSQPRICCCGRDAHHANALTTRTALATPTASGPPATPIVSSASCAPLLLHKVDAKWDAITLEPHHLKDKNVALGSVLAVDN